MKFLLIGLIWIVSMLTACSPRANERIVLENTETLTDAREDVQSKQDGETDSKTIYVYVCTYTHAHLFDCICTESLKEKKALIPSKERNEIAKSEMREFSLSYFVVFISYYHINSTRSYFPLWSYIISSIY